MSPGVRTLLRILLPLCIACLAMLFVICFFFPKPVRIDQTVFADDTTSVINILIIGKDARALNPAADCGTQRIARQHASHSDIVIVCHIRPDRGILNLVALPRDLLVNIPGSTNAAGPTDFTHMDKLTHAFAIGGEPLLRRTLEQFLGINIHRYVAFDFDSFRMAFDLLRFFAGRLSVDGHALRDRNEALSFARRRNGLRFDDLDRCRNALKLIKAVALATWRFAGSRTGDRILSELFRIVGPDTDLRLDEAQRLADALRARRFDPSSIGCAVLVSEGRPVTLWRYDMTLSCYLPVYSEIERQIRRYLLDSLNVSALDFMTQEPYQLPGYFNVDYDSLSFRDTLATTPVVSSQLDSARLSTRLAELRAQGLNPDSLLPVPGPRQ